MLHVLLNKSSDAYQEKLRSRCLFVPAVRNLLNNLAGLGIPASQWTNYKWNAECCESTFRLPAFIRITSPVRLSFPGTTWVNFNRLRIGVGRLYLSNHKWGLAHSPNYECGVPEQTADLVLHVLIARSIFGHHMEFEV